MTAHSFLFLSSARIRIEHPFDIGFLYTSQTSALLRSIIVQHIARSRVLRDFMNFDIIMFVRVASTMYFGNENYYFIFYNISFKTFYLSTREYLFILFILAISNTE